MRFRPQVRGTQMRARSNVEVNAVTDRPRSRPLFLFKGGEFSLVPEDDVWMFQSLRGGRKGTP